MAYISPISPVAKSIHLIDSDGYYAATNLEDLAKEQYEALTTNTPAWNIDINSLKIQTGAVQITSLLDEDDMASDLATALATQQSIKKYVDDAVGGSSLYAFKTITGITNDVVADQIADSLTLGSANNLLTIVGTTATDTITWTVVEGNFVLDGNTVQIDGINSDGGAFNFLTTGVVTFNQPILNEQAAGGNRDNFVLQPQGAPAAGLIKWAHSIRATNDDYWIYSYDGTTFKDWVMFDFGVPHIILAPLGTTMLTLTTTAATIAGDLTVAGTDIGLDGTLPAGRHWKDYNFFVSTAGTLGIHSTTGQLHVEMDGNLTITGTLTGVTTLTTSGNITCQGVIYAKGGAAEVHRRDKLVLYGSGDAHGLGTESYCNTYGPAVAFANTIIHKFYTYQNDVALRIGNVGGAGAVAARVSIYNPNDNAGFYTGIGNDLRMYHSGTHSYLANETGALVLVNNAANHIYFDSHGQVNIRDLDDSSAILWSFDTTARTLAIGLSTDLVNVTHAGSHAILSTGNWDRRIGLYDSSKTQRDQGWTNFTGALLSSGRLMNQETQFHGKVAGVDTALPTGWSRYNNAGGITPTWSYVDDDTAPNWTGRILRVTNVAAEASTPGLGGIYVGMSVEGTRCDQFGKYRKGDRFLFRIWAKITSGYTIQGASNVFGDNGSRVWLTPQVGDGTYREYLYLYTVGTTGTFSSVGHFYFDGTDADVVVADVASVEALNISGAGSPYMLPKLNVGNYDGTIGWGELYTTGDAVIGGNVGIGAAPTGWGTFQPKLFVKGASGYGTGPHAAFVVDDGDDVPALFFHIDHNAIQLGFDAYWDGTNWRSGSALGNSMIQKSNLILSFWGENSIAVGGAITWAELGSWKLDTKLFTLHGDLAVYGGNISVTNVNGGIDFNDASSYWLRTATNYGLYWNTSSNLWQWHVGGVTKWQIDMSGNVTMAGDLTVSGGTLTLNDVVLDRTAANTVKFASGDYMGFNLGTTVNEYSTDGTLVGNSDDALVTEKAIKTYVDKLAALLMLGSANADYVPCAPIHANNINYNWLTWTMANVDAVDCYWYYICLKPQKLGTLKLHLSGWRMGLQDADGNDYITAVDVYANTETGLFLVNNDPTNRNTRNDFTHSFTKVDVSNREQVIIRLSAVNTTAGQLEVSFFKLKCHYE